MKSMFRGYYPPSDEEFERLWTEGTIVLDTNALLHFFRYSAATRDELMDLLKKEQARLWLPHQVGAEFHKNRRGIPGQQRQAFTEVETALDKARNGVQGAIDTLGRHATQEAKDLSSVLKKHDSKLRKELKRARKRHANAVTSAEAQDTTFQAITELYEGRVGKGYGSDELEKLFKEGAVRYAKGLPPGFADAKNKDGDRKYGDLIVWRQVLDHATAAKKPMLFITDDAKEDWWDKAGGQTFGPRPELVEEYYEVSGERVHFYSVRRFLAQAKNRGEEISDASVEEARQVSTVADFKASTARRRSMQRMIDEIGHIRINSAEFEAMAERGRRTFEDLNLSDALVRDLRLSDWAPEMSHLNINESALNHMSEQARKSLRHYGNEPQISEVARHMLWREEEASNRLRKLGLLEGSEGENVESDESLDSDKDD